MTPKELCDIAAKINAAVPGLVPDMRPNEFEPEVDPSVRIGFELRRMPDAAAMMLGRVWAHMYINEKRFSELRQYEHQLTRYVATTLPGAKP